MITYYTLQTLIGGLVGFGIGGGGASLAGAGASILAPRLAAKLITSPSFVRWLTTPVTRPNALSAHIGRLAAIAVAEPEIAEAIDQYTSALRAAP